jgi:hypothetical protein
MSQNHFTLSFPFCFTGKIDKLTIKIGPSQLSEVEKQTSAAIQKASD